jgi:hypothetical protein
MSVSRYVCWAAVFGTTAQAQKQPALTFPPTIPDCKASLSHTGDEFLKPPATLRKDVDVAKAAPTVEHPPVRRVDGGEVPEC